MTEAATAARSGAALGRGTQSPGGERWERRPVLGAIIRMLALAVPVVASVASAVALSRLVPRPSDLLPLVGWWALITVASTAALVAVDRGARRLLPLVALLRLSMLFPDRAPSRFSVAFRAGTTRNLQEQLADAGRRGIDDEPARSAERILTLVAALNRHDRATRGHSERVRAFNDLIAEELRLPQPDRDRLRWAALLHDVGKLEVPARILNKAGRPTEAEWDALRRHPEEGARIAAPLLGWLGPWAPAIVEHHERWDGTGYPRGLAGGEISLAGRIVAVADVFEVLTAPRPYRRPVSAGAARAELARCAGTQFDPAVVRAFLSVSLGRLQRVMGPVSWVAQLPFIGALPALQSTVAGVGRSGITAAATATGVGALTVSGVMGPNQPDRPGSHAGVPMSQAGPEAAGRRPANAGGAGSTADVDTTRPRSAGQAAPAAGKPIPGGAPRPADGTGGNDPAPPPRLPTSQAPLSVRLDLSDKLGAGVTLDQGVGVDVRLGDQTVSARTP